MRKLAMALAFFGLAALTAMGQQTDRVNTSRSNVKNNLPQVVSGPFGKVWCATPPAGKPAACTPSQVAQLSTALAKNSDAKATPKTSVKSVALKDGSLTCTTSSETVSCTSAHIADLNQGARAVTTQGISGK